MYIHEEGGLVFLAQERAASRSVGAALEGIDFKMVGAHHDGPDQGLRTYGLPMITVVRNHWDSMVSWWFNARMSEKESRPTLVWLSRFWSRNRYLFRPGRMFRFLELPNVIALRYENLDEDLNHVLEKFGFPQVELPHVGVSEEREGRHYSEFYDSETRLLIDWAFRPEINDLGYSFEEVPSWHEEPEEISFNFPRRDKPDEKPVKLHGPLAVSLDAVIVSEEESEG